MGLYPLVEGIAGTVVVVFGLADTGVAAQGRQPEQEYQQREQFHLLLPRNDSKTKKRRGFRSPAAWHDALHDGLRWGICSSIASAMAAVCRSSSVSWSRSGLSSADKRR